MGGIIKQIQVTELIEDASVIWFKNVYTIGKKIPYPQALERKDNELGPNFAKNNISELSTLVIEYFDCCGRCIDGMDECAGETRQLIIDDLQWQYILDNNLIGQRVDFEKIGHKPSGDDEFSYKVRIIHDGYKEKTYLFEELVGMTAEYSLGLAAYLTRNHPDIMLEISNYHNNWIKQNEVN